MIYDTQSHVLESFKNNQNITLANSIKQVAQETSCIITMLPNNDSVKIAYTDDNEGILR